jgi:hypothetical protein
MVAGAFESLLEELGSALNIKGLSLDSSNTCLIRFPSGLEVYIEPSTRASEDVLIYTKVGKLSVGRFREDVLREALKANGYPYPRYGTFAFSENNEQLVLFQYYPMKNITGDRIADFLTIFMKRALAWKEQIDGNQIPLASTIETTGASAGRSRGFFGGLL